MARYIDADNLVSVLDILCDKGGDIRYWEQLKWIVADCPTADVRENVHAHWIRNKECAPDVGEYECSHCHRESFIDNDFCGNCGAVMDERREDDNQNAD